MDEEAGGDNDEGGLELGGSVDVEDDSDCDDEEDEEMEEEEEVVVVEGGVTSFDWLRLSDVVCGSDLLFIRWSIPFTWVLSYYTHK